MVEDSAAFRISRTVLWILLVVAATFIVAVYKLWTRDRSNTPQNTSDSNVVADRLVSPDFDEQIRRLITGLAPTCKRVNLTGRVLGPNGEPVTGARVRYASFALVIADIDTSIKSEVGGHFELKDIYVLTPVSILASSEGTQTTRHDISLDTLSSTERTLDIGTLQLVAPECRLTGVVLDSNGKSVAGTEVSLETVSEWTLSPMAGMGLPVDRTLTDVRGQFEFRCLTPGEYAVNAAWNDVDARYTDTDAPSATTRVELSRGETVKVTVQFQE